MRKTSTERKPFATDFGYVFHHDWWL